MGQRAVPCDAALRPALGALTARAVSPAMTSRPPISLVKRDTHLFVAGVLDAPGDDSLLAFVGQGLPHQAYLAGLGYGPVGG